VRLVERLLVLIGFLFAAAYGLHAADAHWGRLHGLAQMTVATSAVESPVPDHTNWAQSRWQAFLSARDQAAGIPWGALAIPAIGIEVPVFADTSDVHLNRGAGLIEGTSYPGAQGNVGIAGHRDGFFRALRQIERGQRIEVRTARAQFVYRVASIAVVDAEDARLLQTTAAPVITLVTCYPFYFVGSAPRRFVVRGVLVSSVGSGRSS
jgi:sortase A